MKHGYRITVIAPRPSNGVVEQYRVRVLDTSGVALESGLDDSSAMAVVDGGEASIGLLAPGSYTVELIGRRITRRTTVRIQDADTAITIR